MAKRLIFEVGNDSLIYSETLIDFQYFSGFSTVNKQKSVDSLHKRIRELYGFDKHILEISSKSTEMLGRMLSAFKLSIEYNNRKVYFENIFQSSKVFLNGGPFLDLLYISPSKAKKDFRLRESGKLIGFRFDNRNYPLEPKSLFYDWLYCKILNTKKEIIPSILNYEIFTDIEFNHIKSYNCQARSAAIFVSLYKKGLIEDALKSIKNFSEIVYNKSLHTIENFEQIQFKL